MRRRNSDKHRATNQIVEHNVRARRDPRAEPDADEPEVSPRPRVRSPIPDEPSGVRARDASPSSPSLDPRAEPDGEPEGSTPPEPAAAAPAASEAAAPSVEVVPPPPPLGDVAPLAPLAPLAPPPAPRVAPVIASVPSEPPERPSSLPPPKLAERLSALPPRMDREDLRLTRRQLAEVRARLASAQLDLAKLTEARAGDAEVLAETLRDLEAARKEARDAHDVVQLAKAEAEALRGKVRDLAHAHHENVTLKATVEKVDGERQGLASRLGELAAKLDLELSSKKALEEKVIALKHDVALLKGEQGSLENERARAEAAEGKLRELDQELGHLRKALEQGVSEKRTLEGELQKAREDGDAQRRALAERDIAALEAEEKLETARTDAKRAHDRIDVMERDRASLSVSVDDLARSLSATEADRDAVRKRLDLVLARLLEVRRSVGDVELASATLLRAQEAARGAVEQLVDTATRSHTQHPGAFVDPDLDD